MNTGLIISRLLEAPAPAEEALARAPVDTSSPGECGMRANLSARKSAAISGILLPSTGLKICMSRQSWSQNQSWMIIQIS